MEKVEKPLSMREKLVVILVVMLIKIIKPFEYSHEYDGLWTQMKRVMNGADLYVEEKK